MPRFSGFLLVALVSLLPLRLPSAAAETGVTFQQLRVGQAVVSVPAHWNTLGPEIPVWLHLHGASATVEAEFASIGAPGVLINVTLPGLSKVYADFFADPKTLEELLRATEAALRNETSLPAPAPTQPWRLGRLTVSSFSAGFGGVRQLLAQPAAFDRIGTLVMADSIYCGYAGDPAARRVDPGLMAGFVKFARLASEGQKRLLITHSRQVPAGYASTTETAEYLIQQLGGARSAEPEEWSGGLRLLTSFTQGQFDVLGFDGDSAEDHLRHLRALGSFYERVAPPAATARAARTLDELRAQLEKHLDDQRFRSALWGVKVASLDTGRVLFERHADRLQSPASNSKLYAGALALDRLGGDYRIVTPIFGTVAADATGTLGGDVIVGGRGDPSWKSDAKRAEFWKTFAPFVAALQRAGVRRITGDLIADATHFQMLPNGAGWTADDLNDYYGAEISAITLEDNYVELQIAPAAEVGQRAALRFLQPHSGLGLDNRVVTTPEGGTRRIEARRIFGENIVHVFGEMPQGAAPFVEDVTVPRPASWFAAALHEALQRAGITVDGRPRSVRWPEASPITATVVKLGEVASPPLRELVSAFMKPSQNLETDLIFAHVGETTRAAAQKSPMGTSGSTFRTSEQLGVAALRDFLRRNGLPADEVRFEEGSGLSRNNLTTANATVALLQFMAKHRESAAFLDSLPIAGVDGTLRRRMKGTPAGGNVRAKTGTLRYANALSGYVSTAAGERLVFSVLLNRAVVAPGRNARDDVDAIAVMLAAFAGRSEW